MRNLTCIYANYKCAAHSHKLINAYVVRCLDSCPFRVSNPNISSVYCIVFGTYALVICNHAPPHPRGIAGTLTFVLQIPAKSPALRGHPVGKTTALSPPPHSLLCFHCTAMFAYIRQTPGIYPALQGQSKSKNTAKLLPPSGGGGAVVTND